MFTRSFIYLFLFFSILLTGQDYKQLGNDINGEAENNYSGSVSLNSNGDRLAIGASRNSDNGTDAGQFTQTRKMLFLT